MRHESRTRRSPPQHQSPSALANIRRSFGAHEDAKLVVLKLAECRAAVLHDAELHRAVERHGIRPRDEHLVVSERACCRKTGDGHRESLPRVSVCRDGHAEWRGGRHYLERCRHSREIGCGNELSAEETRPIGGDRRATDSCDCVTFAERHRSESNEQRRLAQGDHAPAPRRPTVR